MKVLFISSWYPNSVNHLKGVYVKKHAAAIHSAGIDIEILALTVNPSSKLYERRVYEKIDENGVKTHMIEINSRFYKLLYVNLPLQFRLLKGVYYKNIIKNFKPDVIHSNVLFPAAILGYWLSIKEKIPHIITEHWSKVDRFMSKSLYSKTGIKAYNSAKKITVVSDFLKKDISKYIKDKEKIIIVPNVVDTKLFNFKEKTKNPSTAIFTCVAHWSAPKRPDLIFNALNNLASKTEKEISLNVVGEGVLMNELKKNNWNFKVNYLGNKLPADLATLLHDSDYFLHASDMETFSIVIAEAMATGTPVLASNVGAVPELINDQNGFVTNNSLIEWEGALLKLVVKADFKHNLISSATQKFSIYDIGNRFKEVYETTL